MDDCPLRLISTIFCERERLRMACDMSALCTADENPPLQLAAAHLLVEAVPDEDPPFAARFFDDRDRPAHNAALSVLVPNTNFNTNSYTLFVVAVFSDTTLIESLS